MQPGKIPKTIEFRVIWWYALRCGFFGKHREKPREKCVFWCDSGYSFNPWVEGSSPSALINTNSGISLEIAAFLFGF